jgi:hypothetical protein
MEEVACIFQSEERTKAMNKEIMKDAGFEKEVHRVMAGLCPFCDNKPVEKDFRNEVSLREFKISGLCQQCQDKVFGTEIIIKDSYPDLNRGRK